MRSSNALRQWKYGRNSPCISCPCPHPETPSTLYFLCLLKCTDWFEQMITSYACCLWQRRNILIFQHLNITTLEAVNQVSMCADFKEACCKPHNPSSTNLQWRPLESGSWKLNVDGALFLDHYRTGASFIQRDHLGRVVATITHPQLHVVDPMEVELLAIFRGCSFVPRQVSQRAQQNQLPPSGPSLGRRCRISSYSQKFVTRNT